MNMSIRQVVEFRDTDGKVCGTYHYDDPYKSFFRGLFTPNDLDVVAPPPPDHPHHKGLQFGLCAEDVNFWEESADPDNRRIGRQETQSIAPLSGSDATGFRQQIIWRDDLCVSFTESRTLFVLKHVSTAYAWTWRTTLTAARDLNLIRSAWAKPPAQIGYCGLGLRLTPDLFLTGTLTPEVSSGSAPSSVTFRGARAGVTFEQNIQMQRDVLYVSRYNSADPRDFAFMSLGPTNGGPDPLALKQGERLERKRVANRT
jgi:hypothetical protein